MAKRFAKGVERYFERHPQAKIDGIKVRQLHALLDDYVDVAIQEKEKYEKAIEDDESASRPSGSSGPVVQGRTAYIGVGVTTR